MNARAESSKGKAIRDSQALAGWRVHPQERCRRPSRRSLSFNHGAVDLKMLVPVVAPRAEELHYPFCFRIYRAQIRSLVKITVVAGQREILDFIATAVLSRHDMIHVKWRVNRRGLLYMAEFAAVSRTLPDQAARSLVDHAARPTESLLRAFA